MTAFEDPYWNLAQAAAWVVYREAALVNELADAGRHSFGAIGMYPSMWPAGRQFRGSVQDLHRALIDGRLSATGIRNADGAARTDIPKTEWIDLDLRPPDVEARGSTSRGETPWTEVRVASADVKKLWRSPFETAGRSKFDWDVIREIYDEVKKDNPDFSQNKLGEEIQLAFEERFNKEPPGPSSLKAKLKQWR